MDKNFIIMITLSFVVHLWLLLGYAVNPNEPTKTEPLSITVRFEQSRLGLLASRNSKKTQEISHQSPSSKLNQTASDARLPSSHHPSSTMQGTKVSRSQSRSPHKKQHIARTVTPRLKKEVQGVAVHEQYEPASKGFVTGKHKSVTKRPEVTYDNMIGHWFDKFREYPKELFDQGIAGEGVVYIKINRKGEILLSKIVKSTGHDLLDGSLLKMIRNANPVIPFPPDYMPHKRFLSYEILFVYDPVKWKNRSKEIAADE